MPAGPAGPRHGARRARLGAATSVIIALYALLGKSKLRHPATPLPYRGMMWYNRCRHNGVLHQSQWESRIRLRRRRAEPNRVLDGPSPMLRGDCHAPSVRAVTSESPRTAAPSEQRTRFGAPGALGPRPGQRTRRVRGGPRQVPTRDFPRNGYTIHNGRGLPNTNTCATMGSWQPIAHSGRGSNCRSHPVSTSNMPL